MSTTLQPTGLPARVPFYYGWVILVVAALGMTATFPGRTHGIGMITEPLLKDLRIDRVTFSELNFWGILLGAAFCWPIGRLLDRFGSRIVLSVVAGSLGLSVMLMTLCETPTTLLLSLILIRGFGQGALSVVTLALVGKWFVGRLSTAMGWMAVLLAIGFIGATFAFGAAIQQVQWKAAWNSLGMLLLFGMAPLAWLLTRDSPESCRVPSDGAMTPEAHTCHADHTLKEALQTPAFWVFTLATSLFGLIFSAITLYNQAILEEHGFDAKKYYLSMAVLTAGGLVANLVAGGLAYRVSLRRLLAVGMAFLAVVLILFPEVRTLPALIIYSSCLGMAGGILTVVHFTFYGRAFGRRHLGQIQGASQILSVFASALGPVLLTAGHRNTGSYDSLFIPAGMMALVLSAAAWVVPMPRRIPVLQPSPA